MCFFPAVIANYLFLLQILNLMGPTKIPPVFKYILELFETTI